MRSPFLLLLLILIAPSCRTPEDFVEQADRDSYELVRRGREAAGQEVDPDFSIEPRTDRLREKLLPARLPDAPGPVERLALEGEVVRIDLDTALAIAARNSREYQFEKEELYQAALNLTGQLDNFTNQWSGTAGLTVLAAGDGTDNTNVSFNENGDLGFTRLLESGGSLAVSIGNDFTRFLTEPFSTVATNFVNIFITIPLLQNAGRLVAYEGVRQSERNVIYAVRDFERFKRVFAVGVVSDYLRLLGSYQTVINEKQNFERRELTAEENRFLGTAGRLAATDVERANQALLLAESRRIGALQSYETALDRFKISLGLPTDAQVEIDIDDVKRIEDRGLADFPLDEMAALTLGLDSRLDLATTEDTVVDAARQVKITARALDAGLDFTASTSVSPDDQASDRFDIELLGDGNYSIGLLLDLPLERTAERNAYRNSIISYERSKRSYEAFEDNVKLQIRSDLRQLKRALQDFRIQLRAREVASTNVEAARLLKDAGEGTTNDLIDAQNDLITAQNAVIDALTDYEIARLQLLRDMGILVVGPEGIDDEKTAELLGAGA